VVDTASSEVYCGVLRAYGIPCESLRPELMLKTQIILKNISRQKITTANNYTVMRNSLATISNGKRPTNQNTEG
jgi:hypothetical protein